MLFHFHILHFTVLFYQFLLLIIIINNIMDVILINIIIIRDFVFGVLFVVFPHFLSKHSYPQATSPSFYDIYSSPFI